MRYEKPLVLDNNDIAEGVFTSSGMINTCYSVSANIHQRPETGRGDYRIQVNAQHNADHNNNGQILTISFNQPVLHKSGGSLIDGGGTPTLRIQYNYFQNRTDNIGLGDLVVESEPGLEITGISMSDDGFTF